MPRGISLLTPGRRGSPSPIARFEGGLTQPDGCYTLLRNRRVAIRSRRYEMGFPDQIERTVEIAHPPAMVWAALTTAEGLGSWFGHAATIDLRSGGAATMT